MHRATARFLLVLLLVGIFVPVALAISAAPAHACCLRKPMHGRPSHDAQFQAPPACCQHDCCRPLTASRGAHLTSKTCAQATPAAKRDMKGEGLGQVARQLTVGRAFGRQHFSPRRGPASCVLSCLLDEQEHFRQPWEWALPHALSANVDDRALHEVYAWPFADAVRAGVAAVMCSYNMVNNSYACANSKLLNGVLKHELGFQVFVVSDWLAQRSGVASALAGLDMEQPGSRYFGAALKKAVESGEVPQARLDDMVVRILRTEFASGIVDRPRPPKVPDATAGFEIAQRAAEASMVLFKNDNRQLPLKPATLRSIAVIGGLTWFGNKRCVEVNRSRPGSAQCFSFAQRAEGL